VISFFATRNARPSSWQIIWIALRPDNRQDRHAAARLDPVPGYAKVARPDQAALAQGVQTPKESI
jgi:hypothetical protein